MNLIERIREAMDDDDADPEDQSFYLLKVYEDADKATKDQLDGAFIALCGWSLGYLLALDA